MQQEFASFLCYFLLFAKVIGFSDSFQHYATIENKTQLLIQKNSDEREIIRFFVSKKEWWKKFVRMTFGRAFLCDLFALIIVPVVAMLLLLDKYTGYYRKQFTFEAHALFFNAFEYRGSI